MALDEDCHDFAGGLDHLGVPLCGLLALIAVWERPRAPGAATPTVDQTPRGEGRVGVSKDLHEGPHFPMFPRNASPRRLHGSPPRQRHVPQPRHRGTVRSLSRLGGAVVSAVAKSPKVKIAAVGVKKSAAATGKKIAAKVKAALARMTPEQREARMAKMHAWRKARKG